MGINKGSLLALATFIILLGTTLSSSLKAQESNNVDQNIEQEYIQERAELTRAALQSDRKAIVNQHMNLTSEENQAFWPLYKEYRSEAAKLDDRLAKIILDYGASYKKQNIYARRYFSYGRWPG